MTQESSSGKAVAERVRAANIAVGDNNSVEAMLANSLRERKPLADDGALHDSIQAAENAASSFVFVPPGTFNESVTIDTAGLTLLGSGRATLIDGGTTGHAVEIDALNITIQNLSVKTTNGAGNSFSGVKATSNGDDCTVESVTIVDSDSFGIRMYDGTNFRNDWNISNCVVENSEDAGLSCGNSTIIDGCVVESTGTNDGIGVEHDSIISNCVVQNAGEDGLSLGGSGDNIVIGNRVISASRYGIINSGPDTILANNRVSDSGTGDINDSGSGTTLDANLTGASN